MQCQGCSRHIAGVGLMCWNHRYAEEGKRGIYCGCTKCFRREHWKQNAVFLREVKDSKEQTVP